MQLIHVLVYSSYIKRALFCFLFKKPTWKLKKSPWYNLQLQGMSRRGTWDFVSDSSCMVFHPRQRRKVFLNTNPVWKKGQNAVKKIYWREKKTNKRTQKASIDWIIGNSLLKWWNHGSVNVSADVSLDCLQSRWVSYCKCLLVYRGWITQWAPQILETLKNSIKLQTSLLQYSP